MKILHYFLGFPPYRTGGLTKYAFDLMTAQVEDGHSVVAFWPGRIGIISKKVSLRPQKPVCGIKNYELINPLPIPLDEGISEVEAYIKSCDIKAYKTFLGSIQPQVIHIHTLMGLHKEFFDVAEQLRIRTVFTTHDYFGICPKVTLFRQGETCDNDNDCKMCVRCNQNALSLSKIIIMQTPFYRILKNTLLVRILRKHHRNQFFNELDTTFAKKKGADIEILAQQYKQLRMYYINMLKKICLIHFNSTVAKDVYLRYFVPKNSKVLTISHRDIKDNRYSNVWKPEKELRLTFLASPKPYKGFAILKEALDDLWNCGIRNFYLKIYGNVYDKSPYMIINSNGFKQEDLKVIFANTDVLVAPSVWYETFGFTVLEALSYGVPVIVSDRVGAKDILGKAGIVIKAGSVEELKNAIKDLTLDRQKNMRQAIKDSIEIMDWKKFVKCNYELYQYQF